MLLSLIVNRVKEKANLFSLTAARRLDIWPYQRTKVKINDGRAENVSKTLSHLSYM